MGIVNVTPDSFSDGGLFLEAERAIAHGRELAEDGADILDIGGESTRPGAEAVPADVELERVVPVVEALCNGAGPGIPISIDTSKAVVAAAALDAGAQIVNDVTALRGDPELAALCADRRPIVVLMHMLGDPRTMQDDPRYDDVVAEVGDFLEARAEAALAAGVPEVWIDPGIGFGKTAAHNLELLAHLDELVATGLPVVVGTSRKAFLGRLLGASDGLDEPVPTDDRLEGSLATATWALANGAAMVRVHDVRATRQAVAVVAGQIPGAA